MLILSEKLIFLSISVSFYLQAVEGQYRAVPVLFTIIFSAVSSLFEKSWVKLLLAGCFIAASLQFPQLLFFLPLICTDVYLSRYPAAALLAGLPVLLNRNDLSQDIPIQLFLLGLLGWILVRRALHISELREQAVKIRDDVQEKNLQLEQKQNELLEKQDYEINLARLAERNRIARDIHDKLGHQLSRAIIQLGALGIICRDSEAVKQIESVRLTLTDGMNNIRDSIHRLHNDSIPLEQEIRKMTEDFEFCPVVLDYSIRNEPSEKYRNTISAIIREALTNVMKHSQASRVDITIHEHPAFYQLIIEDNGSQRCLSESKQAKVPYNNLEKPNEIDGMGINGMRERVSELHGSINIFREAGFRIFVSLPRA
jgi:signal transduction histidine kinase